MKDLIIGLLIIFVVVGMGLGVVAGLKAVKCHIAWKDSGMQSEYRFIGGCMVQRKDGTWWPASTIREVSP